MIYAPIWKDTYYTFNSEYLDYSIEVDGSEIFSGRAWKYPDALQGKVNINKICQNYLNSDIADLLDSAGSTTIYNSEAFRVFTLKNSYGTTLETYGFLMDWSYSDYWNGAARKTLSNPIDGKYSPDMIRFTTEYVSGNVRTSNTNTGQYNKLSCGDYAIYYLNSYGGWDSFLITGNVIKTDKVEQYNYNQSFNNTTREFEKGRYIATIETSYVLNTGYLTDSQSENLCKNLLATNKAYLHNLKDGKIIPVVVTNTENTYKTYRNQGNNMVNYQIKVVESQSKVRG